jgi:hypothetical protein
MTKEMQGSWVGPMPIQDFMDEFVPLSKDTPPSPKLPELFAELTDKKLEKEMYSPFVRHPSVPNCQQLLIKLDID